MQKYPRRSLVAVAGLAALVAFGCGGGRAGSTNGSTNGNTNGGTTSGDKTPTAKTKADVGQNVKALGDSVVSSSLFGFGSKITAPDGEFYDPRLGLYALVHISPSGISEHLFTDSARTNAAGSMIYTINEAAGTFTGPIDVQAGKYAGLSGVYFEAVQPDGFNGNINYSTADGTTVVVTYAVTRDEFGRISGAGTAGVAFSDYTQNQQVTYNIGESYSLTTLDSLQCRMTLNVNSDGSGSGRITGSDPGLPAVLDWNADGSGTIVYANNSTQSFTHWTLQG